MADFRADVEEYFLAPLARVTGVLDSLLEIAVSSTQWTTTFKVSLGDYPRMQVLTDPRADSGPFLIRVIAGDGQQAPQSVSGLRTLQSFKHCLPACCAIWPHVRQVSFLFPTSTHHEILSVSSRRSTMQVKPDSEQSSGEEFAVGK